MNEPDGRSLCRLLPSPGVSFGPNFAARVGRLAARVAAARERREGAGQARLFGAGSEFVGYRAYRPGEDLRLMDWSLYARTQKPFVRITRREASEEWALLLDTSASMGVGQRGKLQLAAEFAAAAASTAMRMGAAVNLIPLRGPGLRLRSCDSIAPIFSFLERQEARGSLDWQDLTARAGRFRSAGRVIFLGDLFGLEPRNFLGLLRPGRELQVVQILAPEELSPQADLSVEWVDPETGQRLVLRTQRDVLAAYDEGLSGLLENWGHQLSQHRVAYSVWSSARPFEDLFEKGLF